MTEYFDRSQCNPFIYQRGYIEVVVEPVITLWVDFLSSLKEDQGNKPVSNYPSIRSTVITKGLEKNKELINEKI